MIQEQIIHARSSMRTAVLCWLTKMLAQWLIICGPFIIVFSQLCPSIIPMLTLKLIGYSLLLATIDTYFMMKGEVVADKAGIHYLRFGRKSRSIPWNEMELRKPLPITLERPLVVCRRGKNISLRIWPSMNGYQQISDIINKHVSINQTPEFRSFDEVLGEAFRQ